MKGDEKWVVCGSGVTQGHQKHSHSRARTTSYLTLIETVHLFCTVFEL